MSRESLLTRTFVQLADTLVADFDIVELLTMLSDTCVEALDVAAAGLMLVAPEGELRVVASSSEAMRMVELFELQAQEGPSLDCFRTGEPVLNRRLGEANPEWPSFEKVAINAGFAAVHALPMRLRGQSIGALNLFQVDAHEMDDENVAAGQALADAATITILQQEAIVERELVNTQLNNALTSRILIEQAKGVLSGTGLDMEDAFDMMRQHARRHGLKLLDVASGVTGGTVTAASLIAAKNEPGAPAR